GAATGSRIDEQPAVGPLPHLGPVLGDRVRARWCVDRPHLSGSAQQLSVSPAPADSISGRTIVLDTGELVTIPEMSELEIRAVETMFRDTVLSEVGRYSVIALVALFFLSLAVGWIMS